jgi:hypothetical protein
MEDVSSSNFQAIKEVIGHKSARFSRVSALWRRNDSWKGIKTKTGLLHSKHTKELHVLLV